MRRTKYVGLVMVAVLMVLALVASCAPAAPKEAGPIKIGFLGAYSGIAVGTGELIEHGVRLALDEANWEVAGRKIELIVEDSGSVPDITMDKARKLVEVDKVDVIIGPLQSDAAVAAAAVCEEAGIPNLAIFDHGPSITKYETLIIPAGLMLAKTRGLGRYAYDKLGCKTATLLMPDYIGGHHFGEGFIYGFEERGGTINEVVWYPPDALDYSPFFPSVGTSDCVLTFWTSPPFVLRFVSQYREYGLSAKLLTSAAESIAMVFQDLGDKGLGIIGSASYTPAIETDINKRYVRAHLEKYGFPPTAFDAASYRDAGLFLKAVEMTGGDTTPEKIVDILSNMSFDSPEGPLEIVDRLGMPTFYITEVIKKDGVYQDRVVESYKKEPVPTELIERVK